MKINMNAVYNVVCFLIGTVGLGGCVMVVLSGI